MQFLQLNQITHSDWKAAGCVQNPTASAHLVRKEVVMLRVIIGSLVKRIDNSLETGNFGKQRGKWETDRGDGSPFHHLFLSLS